MFRSSIFINLYLALTTLAQTYNDQSVTLYVTDPSCSYYQCEVIKKHGDDFLINWLNAPKGNVEIMFNNEDSKGPNYIIKKSIRGTQSDCYHGENGKRSCGKYELKIPSDWKVGRYSVQVLSLATGESGYTDIVKIIHDDQPSQKRMKRRKMLD